MCGSLLASWKEARSRRPPTAPGRTGQARESAATNEAHRRDRLAVELVRDAGCLPTLGWLAEAAHEKRNQDSLCLVVTVGGDPNTI